MDKNDGQENKHETRMAGSRPRIKPLVAKTISIRENQGGVTYKDLFGNYLRTVKEICITAPFIRQPYSDRQFSRFHTNGERCVNPARHYKNSSEYAK